MNKPVRGAHSRFCYEYRYYNWLHKEAKKHGWVHHKIAELVCQDLDMTERLWFCNFVLKRYKEDGLDEYTWVYLVSEIISEIGSRGDRFKGEFTDRRSQEDD